MFDLGDELTLESYRVPWLIWIQLLVFFLLLALLFCYTLFASDASYDPSSSAAATTASPSASASASTNRFLFGDIQQIDKPLVKHDSTVNLVTNRRQHAQGGENQSITGKMATDASMRREEITEGEGSSVYFHPCHYFKLARVAFLKCLGLDSTSDSPSTRKHMKRKEG